MFYICHTIIARGIDLSWRRAITIPASWYNTCFSSHLEHLLWVAKLERLESIMRVGGLKPFFLGIRQIIQLYKFEEETSQLNTTYCKIL